MTDAGDRVLCVLPARLESRRLPRKLLRPLAGKPLVQWSWEAAREVAVFDAVWIATDAPEIRDAAEHFGATVVRTEGEHACGTDRVAEVATSSAARSFDVVVNYQADEPFLDPDAVSRAVSAVRKERADVATLASPLRSSREWRSSSVVKVVRARDGRALYFTRAPVPFPRDGEPSFGSAPDGDHDARFLRHAGLYAFERSALTRWSRLPASPLERTERLEQLRALEAGMQVHVTLTSELEPGVDVPDDLRRARRLLSDVNLSPGKHHE